MSTSQKKQARPFNTLRHLVMTILVIAALVTLVILTGSLREDMSLGILVPYIPYIIAAEILVLGTIIIELIGRLIYRLSLRRVAQDSATALRIIVRIVGYGVLLSLVVSSVTSNVAAALTTGAFAGMVAGFATQTVVGNAVAGIFMALYRPIRIGDMVTISGNKGRVTEITMMYTILAAEEEEYMIPSSQVISTVVIRHVKKGVAKQ
jgi:small conductance mechanosensitive channel